MGSRVLHEQSPGHTIAGSTLNFESSPAISFTIIGKEDVMVLEITYRTISQLKPYPRNARTHSRKQQRQIAAAIKEFGFTNPALIDERGQIFAAPGGARAPTLLGFP